MKLVSAVALAMLTLGPGIARAQENSGQDAAWDQWGASAGHGAYYPAHHPYAYDPRSYYPQVGWTWASPSWSFSVGIAPSIGFYGGSPGYYGAYPGYYGAYPRYYRAYPGYHGGYPGYYGSYRGYYGGHGPGYYGHYPGPGYHRGWHGGYTGRWR